MSTIRILCVGDLVGVPGVTLFAKHIPQMRTKHAIDIVMVNGENSAPDGRGITPKVADSLKQHGADIITSGNHIWDKKEIYPYLDAHTDILRPLNFPQGNPGIGLTTITSAHGHIVGFINMQGRIFMREHVACPFKTIDSILTYIKSKTSVVIVDFHAEATAEKLGFAYYIDGKVSAVVGTHTHVQTADARVLPGGSAYISDIGMSGSLNSMIGMTKEPVLRQLLTQMPTRFAVDTTPPFILNTVLITVDSSTGKAVEIVPITIHDNELTITNATQQKE